MKLVILDRDGVINEDSPDYIKSAEEWEPIPGSLEAIARLCHAGLRVCIASNQSGLGRGLFSYDDLLDIHDKMQRALAEHGGRIEAIAFAPDDPDAPGPGTGLRKPAPGLLLDLLKRTGIEASQAVMLGDSRRDLEAAKAAGVKPVLVRTGNGKKTEGEGNLDGIDVYDDLAAFAAATVSRAA